MIGQMFDDRFQLLAVLGATNTSMIYLALDSVVDRRVVVRVLRDELATDHESVTVFRNRMHRESSLVYDNILPVYISGDVPSSLVAGTSVPYFVTEFLGGGSLRTMLDANGPLSRSQTVRIGVYIAKALANAHKRSALHLDLRPENVLFADDSDRSLRVKDFGLARALAESSLTEPIAAGPSAQIYSAPEVLAGGEVDGRSDVYSLGLILAESLTGHVPLTGSSTSETYRIRASEDFDPPAEFGPLQAVLAATCRLDRTTRPDAAELVRQLEDIAGLLEKPDALPIVPTLGSGSETIELDRRLITTTEHVSDPGHIDTPGPDPDRRMVEPATDPEPQFGLVVDPDEVASLLAAGRPRSLGPVTPFGADTQNDDQIAGPNPDGDRKRRGRRSSRHEAPPTPMTAEDDNGRGDTTLAKSRGHRRGWTIAIVALLLAAAAGGFSYWWFAIRIPTHTVPRVVGSQIDAASASLEKLNFTVDVSSSERKDGTVAGEVLAQDPAAGTELGEGERVRLVVSLGPTLRVFPSVEHMSLDEAKEAITSSDLVVGEESVAHDEEIPPGVVISAAVAPGGPQIDADGQVPRDTVVDLVVSDGPAPRAVPAGLVGAPAEDARAALEAVQLVATILEEYNETVPVGAIISSSAEPGELLERGAKVTLMMSKGPEPIPIPNVIGMTGSAATKQLEDRGFKVQGIEGSPSGIVLQTDPTPGEKHQRGTAVRIFTKSA